MGTVYNITVKNCNKKTTFVLYLHDIGKLLEFQEPDNVETEGKKGLDDGDNRSSYTLVEDIGTIHYNG